MRDVIAAAIVTMIKVALGTIIVYYGWIVLSEPLSLPELTFYQSTVLFVVVRTLVATDNINRD